MPLLSKGRVKCFISICTWQHGKFIQGRCKFVKTCICIWVFFQHTSTLVFASVCVCAVASTIARMPHERHRVMINLPETGLKQITPWPGSIFLSLLRINCGRRTFTFISVTIVSLFSILIFEATGTALQMAMHTLTSSPGFTRGASVTVIAWLGILGIPVQSTAMLRLCGQLQCDDCRPGFSFADSQSQRLFGFIQIRDPEKTLCQLPPVQFLLFFFILLRSMAQLNQWSHCTGKMLGFNLTFWLWLLGGQGWFEGDTP